MPFSTCRFELPSAAGDFSSPKPGHTTSGSGRGARRIGGAGPGRTGRRQNSSPRRQESLVPPKASKTGLLNVSPEARTSEILCKPNAGTKSPVDKRFVSGLTAGREALFVPGCRPVDRRFFASVNPFHARHVWEYKLGNPVHQGRPAGAGHNRHNKLNKTTTPSTEYNQAVKGYRTKIHLRDQDSYDSANQFPEGDEWTLRYAVFCFAVWVPKHALQEKG